MGEKLRKRIDTWKKLLLDFGKRNRLINFIESKRGNVNITQPSFDKLYDLIVSDEREVSFPYAKKINIDDNGEETYESIITGDINTDRSFSDLQKTLKNLRYKANTSIEERGINTLYLTFGMLKWKEQDNSSQILSSPIILVPVRLLIESITSPYKLALHEDEIVVNPTLSHKLENDFGIVLPTFDAANDEPAKYLECIARIISNKDWTIEKSVHLTNLSFLKINMYYDLERNEDKLNSNSVVSALVGEQNPIQIPDNLNDFDHDKNIRPIDTFQVVDADSSQQDAILLSKKGVSFVLQGPPGTGKSQTITNIIAEAIADGKKVLFVSEKMAALQVVYNRLSNVGLSDFCFTLHSHKAKKKEILNELANSININKTRVREEALSNLNLLERKRESLNEYQDELHTPTSALNCSIFYMNGLLAELENVPDIIFPIENVKTTTQDQFNETKYILGELSKTINKQSEDYDNNVWKGAIVDHLSNELRHDIDSHVAELLPTINDLQHLLHECYSLFSLSLPSSITGAKKLIVLLRMALKSPIFPEQWIYCDDIDALKTQADKFSLLTDSIITFQNDINKKYKPEAVNAPVKQYRAKLLDGEKRVTGCLRIDNKNRLTTDIYSIQHKLNDCKTVIEDTYYEASIVAKSLRIDAPTNLGRLKTFSNALQKLLAISDVRPTDCWFERNNYKSFKSTILERKDIFQRFEATNKKIRDEYDQQIFDLDYYPLLQKFRGEYSSWTRIFKSQYRKDVQVLKSFKSDNYTSYSTCIAVLNDLKDYNELKQNIADITDKCICDYGQYYHELETQWDVLYTHAETFEHIFDIEYNIPSPLKEILKAGTLPIDDLNHFLNTYEHSHLEEIYAQINGILLLDDTDHNKQNYNDIIEICNEAINECSHFAELLEKIKSLFTDEHDYDSMFKLLDRIESYQSDIEVFGEKESALRDLYGNYFDGVHTDWAQIKQSLQYAKEFKTYVEDYSLTEEAVKKICSDQQTIDYCNDCHDRIFDLLNAINKPLNWFSSLYGDDIIFEEFDLKTLETHLTECRDKKYLLEEWIDYCTYRERCIKAGLSAYITALEQKGIDKDYIIDAYLKRFYRLWLDAVLPDFPEVLNFRSRNHEQTINEFCELDKAQFKIAQARVRERAISRMPDFNSISSARDEVAILKRELNKQRRLMPLRKLFISIPNLITSLRPCFMMSPLSVSVFLEAKSYIFDLVIFDEASQVHTEDAIGAIMRGKQVIIVGDTKQLPPTSFFATALGEDDYDIESDEEDDEKYAGAYESILDEAVSVLPERSLRWHYRSRDEHLIAFSNIKIYNNQLITFPSSTESNTDNGVEYIHVTNGVYDRGGKKTNITEAKVVADLVFKHFMAHPDRSLGVVTFSEAQQYAVDSAIRQKRIDNPRFDKFFIEDKEEPFFIKNLENVQGDERDTIIFSIGYAKDNKGIMYMNFGPLSRDGGYRRLNVAITRAKYNVKLVGSIVPTDIDLDRTTSEGVRMLRSYIEYAQHGISAIENEITVNTDLSFDSPFEEAVYDFLQSKGYNVVTQVGCSGFRIDMAVKHPTLNGKFAIGIECDGATYHSSRTARERDRLRQSVLEDMGWKIYRIWSTDWIKDPKTEENKLINAIENSLNSRISYEISGIKTETKSEVPAIEIEETIESTTEEDAGYGFKVYTRVNPFDGDYTGKAFYSRDKLILNVIAGEQPIHFEELCRRVAPLYGRQKATSVVRDDINYLFKWMLSDKVIKDEYDFVKLKDDTHNVVEVRIPDPNDDYIRPINYICRDELALAMKVIAKSSFGITPEGLFVVTAREFGYKRTGDNIIYSLRTVYKDMLHKKEVIEIDGKVNVVDL